MIAVHPLDARAVSPFLLMVSNGLRQTVRKLGVDPALQVLGASFWGQPAGVAVVHTHPEAAQLLDLYVLPAYRNGGIGTALLAAVEDEATRLALGKLKTRYRRDDHTPAFQRVLAKRGWDAPTLKDLVFWTTRERDALHLEWVQKYRFRPPYAVVPWHEVTEAERARIAQRGKEGWYSPDLSPFARPVEDWDPETSLGLRYGDEIVGWVLNVREAPLRLLIEILFVDPPLQRLGKGFMLIGEVTRRCWQIGMEDMYWRAAPDNEPMVRWSRKAFKHVLTDEFEEWASAKALGREGRALGTPDAIKAELRNFYGRVAEQNLQGADAPLSSGVSHRGRHNGGNERNGTGPNGSVGSHFYRDEELGDLPASIVAGSYACGNPHAVANVQPGEVVLDLGSGGGLDVLLAARQVGPTGFVYGVDMTGKMVELARMNAAKVGATNVEFRKSEIESLPLPDRAVDVILANCVFNLSPEQSTVLAEAFRVLKPGGRVAFAEVMVDGDLNDFPISPAQIQAGLDAAGCGLGALSIDEFTRLLATAGFTEIEVTIQERYGPEVLLGKLPPEVQGQLQSLERVVLEELMARFCSGVIQAQKAA